MFYLLNRAHAFQGVFFSADFLGVKYRGLENSPRFLRGSPLPETGSQAGG